MKNLSYIILLINLFHITINEEIYEIFDFLELIRTVKISENNQKNIIKNFKQLLNRYVYLDILKNPPQPKERKDYYNKVDLIKELDTLNTKERSIYEFYGDIRKIISKCQDYHLDINYYNYIIKTETTRISLANSYFISPYFLKIKDNLQVYAIPCNENYFEQNVIQKIKGYQNIPIYKINNEDPLDYIQKLNGNFNILKSPHAQFVLNNHYLSKFPLIFFPFNDWRLTNIKIQYINNIIININYKVFVEDDDIDVKSFNKFRFLKQNNFLNKKNYFWKTEETIKWDFNLVENNYMLKCRVDNKNKVNVIYQNSFNFDDLEKSFDFFDNCFYSFYNNNYPIIVIEDFNNGGSASIAEYFQGYLDLHHIPIEYTSFRYNSDVKNNIANIYSIKDIKTCKSYKGYYAFKYDPVIDNYGENVIHKRTKIFDDNINLDDYPKFMKLKEMAKKNKNIRKPHEILILTDGYSFSAASSFIKGIQLNGGAIVAGYSGNPNSFFFDSSQSPSTVHSTEDSDDKLHKEFKKLGFTVTYTVMEYFSELDYKNEENIPLEYQINYIHERIKIYEPYDDSNYQKFIDESLKILNKYKKECETFNHIIFFSENCVFSDPKMHGGYKCLSQKWSETCVPSYCDEGYRFDKRNQKCEIIKCQKEKKDDDNKCYLYWGRFFLILSLASLIIYIICWYFDVFEKRKYIFFFCLGSSIITIILYCKYYKFF